MIPEGGGAQTIGQFICLSGSLTGLSEFGVKKTFDAEFGVFEVATSENVVTIKHETVIDVMSAR